MSLYDDDDETDDIATVSEMYESSSQQEQQQQEVVVSLLIHNHSNENSKNNNRSISFCDRNNKKQSWLVSLFSSLVFSNNNINKSNSHCCDTTIILSPDATVLEPQQCHIQRFCCIFSNTLIPTFSVNGMIVVSTTIIIGLITAVVILFQIAINTSTTNTTSIVTTAAPTTESPINNSSTNPFNISIKKDDVLNVTIHNQNNNNDIAWGLVRNTNCTTIRIDNNDTNNDHNDDDYRKSVQYCLDVDDDDDDNDSTTTTSSNANSSDNSGSNNTEWCKCTNPLLPTSRRSTLWMKYHQILLNDIKYYHNQREQEQQKHNTNTTERIRHEEHGLDFVWIGDSITEQWNGTMFLGTIAQPEYRFVFEQFFQYAIGSSNGSLVRTTTFNNSSSSSSDNNNSSSSNLLRGIVLGSSADVCNELLWHLEHGILPKQIQAQSSSSSSLSSSNTTTTLLNPKVWIVLIGTNDLGRNNCSKYSTVQGIKNIIEYIETNAPNTTTVTSTSTTTTTSTSNDTAAISMENITIIQTILLPPILIHGLLPRSDSSVNYTVGSMYYDKIVWINTELEQYVQKNNGNTHHVTTSTTTTTATENNHTVTKTIIVQQTRRLFYLNVNHLFVLPNRTPPTPTTTLSPVSSSTLMMIDKELMEDGLHPTAKGCMVWGPLLANTLQSIIASTTTRTR